MGYICPDAAAASAKISDKKCKAGNWCTTGTAKYCNAATCGVTERNSPEVDRSYSTIYGSSAIGTGYARSMLDSAAGWSALTNNANQWIIIEAGLYPINIRGLYVQSRKNSLS